MKLPTPLQQRYDNVVMETVQSLVLPILLSFGIIPIVFPNSNGDARITPPNLLTY